MRVVLGLQILPSYIKLLRVLFVYTIISCMYFQPIQSARHIGLLNLAAMKRGKTHAMEWARPGFQ